MSRSDDQSKFSPRNGHTLKVLCIARISTEHQDERSLADQEALCRAWLDDHASGPYEMTVIRSRASGERLDREESHQAEVEVETRHYDLVITEDLGRIFRRIQAFSFCEHCEDCDTRLVAINDHVDTGQDGWRMNAFFATMRHELYNADTGKRIRRTFRNRFTNGGIVMTFPFGYIKPPGAKSDSDIQKDPNAEPIVAEVFRLLDDGASYCEVADWLNAHGIPTGRYARSRRWTCGLVSKLVHNPIYKGVRVRNARMSKRFNKTGRARSIKAPASERLERNCPHLAFIEPARYDRILAKVDERNGKYRRKPVEGVDPRKNVPRKRTIWPGQHIYCGKCGRMFVYGVHGRADHLVCSGARDYHCWNAVSVDGPLSAAKLSAAIMTEIESLPSFSDALQDAVRRQLDEHNASRDQRLGKLQRQSATLARERDNFVAAIRAGGELTSLVDELRAVEARLRQLNEDIENIERSPQQMVDLPSIQDLQLLARDALARQADAPYEFGRIMRRLIPKIIVFPFRLCGGGPVVLRAKFTLSLAALFQPAHRLDTLDAVLHRELVVDLFDPRQRERNREAVVQLIAEGLTFKEAGNRLGITGTAAQNALALQQIMDSRGLADPYLPLSEPPPDLKKLRRHLHPRYRFEPLDGYPQDL